MKVVVLAAVAIALSGCVSSITGAHSPPALGAERCAPGTGAVIGHTYHLHLVRGAQIIHQDTFDTGLNLKEPYRAETVRPRSYVSEKDSVYQNGRILRSTEALSAANERVLIDVLPDRTGYRYSGEIRVVDYYRRIGDEASGIERPVYFQMQVSGQSELGVPVRAAGSSATPSAYQALFNQIAPAAQHEQYTLEILGCARYEPAAPRLIETPIAPKMP